MIKYSVVVPLHNEEGNVRTLHRKLADVLVELGEPYEIVFVDDASTDGTPRELEGLTESDSRLTVVTFRRNFGQTAALQAGFDFARGAVIIALDGDLQDDPADIPFLLSKLEEGYDVVSGWRRDRKERWLTRRLPSAAANRLVALLSGVGLHDFGTTFKVYRRDALAQVRLYGEMHRFIPAFLARTGAAIAEVPVRNNPRVSGRSHYGLSRVPKVALDLIGLKFRLDAASPARVFGAAALVMLALGVALAAAALLAGVGGWLESGACWALGLASVVVVVGGITLLGVGLIGETAAQRGRSTPRALYSSLDVLTRRSVRSGRESRREVSV